MAVKTEVYDILFRIMCTVHLIAIYWRFSIRRNTLRKRRHDCCCMIISWCFMARIYNKENQCCVLLKRINLQGGGSSSYMLGTTGNCLSGVVGVIWNVDRYDYIKKIHLEFFLLLVEYCFHFQCQSTLLVSDQLWYQLRHCSMLERFRLQLNPNSKTFGATQLHLLISMMPPSYTMLEFFFVRSKISLYFDSPWFYFWKTFFITFA